MRREKGRALKTFLAFGVMCAAVAAYAEQLPILGWHGIPYDEVTVARYGQAKDAGFTHMMQWAPDVKGVLRVLDCARDAGIKLSIHSPCIEGDSPEAGVRAIKNHPALAMYHLRDEPVAKDLPAIGAIARKIMAEDPEHPCYMNWCGVVGKDPMRWYGTPDYRSFIDVSLREVPIQMISFDKYPLIADDAGRRPAPFRDVSDTLLKTNWYETLEIVREVSRARKLPFWAFAISTAHRIPGSHLYPTATVAGMKLQQYSNLAYGAQGVQYFTYWQPEPGDLEFHDAPLNASGEVTFVMDRVRAVNAELQARAYVFVGADAKGVWHTGAAISPHTRLLRESDLPPAVAALRTDGGAVVSHLVNGRDEYLMVVSRELHRDVTLHVVLAKGARRIRTDGSAVPAEWYSDEYRLSPGDAEIFFLPREGKAFRGTDPGVVFAADQGAGGRVIAFDATPKGDRAKVWEWRARSDAAVPAALRGKFHGTTDCRPAAHPDTMRPVVLVAASGGGFARVDVLTRHADASGEIGGNLQSVEQLPDGKRFAGVASAAGKLVLSDPTAGTVKEYPLDSAQAAVWDAKRKLLFAVGRAEAVAYAYDAAGFALTEAKRWKIPEPAGAGIDLVPDGKDGYFILASNQLVAFNPDTGAFTPLRDIAKGKSLSRNARFGDAYSVVREMWWTDRLIVSKDGADREIVIPGAQFYRFRWTTEGK